MLNEFALKFWKVSESLLAEMKRCVRLATIFFFTSICQFLSLHKKILIKTKKNIHVWTRLVMARIDECVIWNLPKKIIPLSSFFSFCPLKSQQRLVRKHFLKNTHRFFYPSGRLLCQFLLVPNAYEPSVLRSHFLECHSQETVVKETMINLAFISGQDTVPFAQ